MKITQSKAEHGMDIQVDDDKAACVSIESGVYNYHELKQLIQALSLAHAQLKEPLEAEHGNYRVYAEKTEDG